MTGYLGGLIERATGAALAVEPRTRTAFEPPPPADRPAAADDAAPAEFDAPRPAARARATVPTQPADDEPTLLPPLRSHPRPVRAPAPGAEEADQPDVSVIPASGGRKPPISDPETGGLRPPLAEDNDSPSPAVGRVIVPNAPPSVAPVAAERTKPAARPPVVAAVAVAPPAPAPRVEPQPEGPPVVRVTIGRVEVRANFPSPPAGRPPAGRPAPRLSLEDYLKGRAGGGR